MSHDPLPIFVSYASYDNKSENPEERWLDRLLQFLRPLDLDANISSWADTELVIGANWRTEIRRAIDRAKVAILLVSPAFLASEFIRSEELPRLLRAADPTNDPGDLADDLAEGMLILPILLRPCLIDHAQFEVLDGPSEARYARVSDFQYVPKGRAMNGLSQYDQDKQFEAVAHRILDALDLERPTFEVKATKDELDLLGENLVDFLSSYSRWWFNAIRIHNWGSKQSGFKVLAEHSTHQINAKLQELASQDKILTKVGNKSQVYKAK